MARDSVPHWYMLVYIITISCVHVYFTGIRTLVRRTRAYFICISFVMCWLSWSKIRSITGCHHEQLSWAIAMSAFSDPKSVTPYTRPPEIRTSRDSSMMSAFSNPKSVARDNRPPHLKALFRVLCRQGVICSMFLYCVYYVMSQLVDSSLLSWLSRERYTFMLYLIHATDVMHHRHVDLCIAQLVLHCIAELA